MTGRPERLSHRDDHRARARMLAADLGRTPTGPEYRAARRDLAATRRREQRLDRMADITDRATFRDARRRFSLSVAVRPMTRLRRFITPRWVR